MRPRRLRIQVSLLLLLLFVAGALPARAQTAFLVHDVRVFDGERVAERRSVLMQGEKIARIGGPELPAPGRD